MAAGNIKGITIEIGGETTGLQKALKQVNNETIEVQKELKQVDKLLKFNPGNAELVAQKQKLLSDQIETTTTKLKALKDAQGQVEAKFKSGEISGAQYRDFNRELVATEGSLNGLKRRMADLQGEQDRLGNSTKQLDRLFDVTGTSVDDFADTLGSKLVRAIKEGTASSKQIDDAIEKIGKASLGASADMDKMRKALASVDDGASLKSVKKELSDVAKEADQAGDKVNAFGDDLKGVAAGLAAGGGIATAIEKALDTSSLDTKIEISMEVPEASKKSVKQAINAVSAYGVDAGEALEGVRRQWALNADASDASNAKVVKGAGAIAAAYEGIDFTELIQETNEISKEMNITNDEALGLVNSLLKIGFPPEQLDIISEYGGQLERAGYKGEEIQAIMAAGVETGTWNIDNLLDGLKEGRIRVAEFGQEVPKALTELLDGTNLSAEQFQKWGVEVAKGGKGGSKAMTEIAKALQGVDDETKRNLIGAQIFGTIYEDQGKNITDTLINAEGKVVDLKNGQDMLNDSVSKLDESPAVKLSKAVSDLKLALAPLLEVIAGVIGKLAEWASANPGLTATVVAVGSAIGIIMGILMALAPIISTVTALWPLLATAVGAISAPVLAVIAVIAALIAIGIALYKNWDEVKSYLGAIWTWISDMGKTVWGGLKTYFTTMLNGYKLIFTTVWDYISTRLSEIWTNIKTVASNIWGGLKTYFSGVLNYYKTMFSTIWGNIKTILSNIWSGLKTTATNTFNNMKTIVTTIFNGIKTKITTIFQSARDILTTAFNAIKSKASSIFSSMRNTLSDIFTGIKTKASSIFNSLKTSISGIFSSIKSTASSVWGQIKTAMVTPVNAAKDAISSAINKIKGFFSGLSLKFPKIQMPALPHFSLSGDFSLKPPRVPKLSVDWYDKGGIFSGPQVIGVGEKRPEFVGALDDLHAIVKGAMQEVNESRNGKGSNGSNGSQSVYITPAPVHIDGKEVAKITFPYTAQMQNRDKRLNSRRAGR